jgi:hypothetical protein
MLSKASIEPSSNFTKIEQGVDRVEFHNLLSAPK